MAQNRFIVGPRTGENPFEVAVKNFGPVGIPQMGFFWHQAINLILQNR